jgi:hypothetical protein
MLDSISVDELLNGMDEAAASEILVALARATLDFV